MAWWRSSASPGPRRRPAAGRRGTGRPPAGPPPPRAGGWPAGGPRGRAGTRGRAGPTPGRHRCLRSRRAPLPPCRAVPRSRRRRTVAVPPCRHRARVPTVRPARRPTARRPSVDPSLRPHPSATAAGLGCGRAVLAQLLEPLAQQQAARAGTARPPASRTGRGPGRRGARPPRPGRCRPPWPGPRAWSSSAPSRIRSTRNWRNGLASCDGGPQALGVGPGQVAGVGTGGQGGHGHVDLEATLPLVEPAGGRLPGPVGVEGQHHPRAKLRSSCTCSSASAVPQVATARSHPGLEEPDDVGVPLAHHHLAGLDDVLLGPVERVERAAAWSRSGSRSSSCTWPGRELPGRTRPPRATGWPEGSQIGKRIRARKASCSRPRRLTKPSPAPTASSSLEAEARCTGRPSRRAPIPAGTGGPPRRRSPRLRR